MQIGRNGDKQRLRPTALLSVFSYARPTTPQATALSLIILAVLGTSLVAAATHSSSSTSVTPAVAEATVKKDAPTPETTETTAVLSAATPQTNNNQQNTNVATVTINGETIAVPANSSVSRTVTTQNGSVNIVSQGSATNSSTYTSNIQTNSSSSSSTSNGYTSHTETHFSSQ